MIETGGGTSAGEGCVMLSADPLSLGKRAQRTRRSAKDALQVPASFYGPQPTQRIPSGWGVPFLRLLFLLGIVKLRHRDWRR